MRLQDFITFDLDPDKAHRILDQFGLQVNEKSIRQSVTVFTDSVEHDLLLGALTKSGVPHLELKSMHFDIEELEEAHLLEMAPAGYWGYPQPEEDFDLYRKESYDTSSKCNICENGSIQNRPLLVKGKPRFGRREILAIHWEYEYIVTDRLRLMIERAGLTGADFWPILDHRKHTPVSGFHQLHVTTILPPMSSSAVFEIVPLERLPKSPCSCGRAGRNLAIHQMVYRRENLTDAQDFNKTFEWLGGGYGTTQWKVVSRKVFRFFRENKIRSVKFKPVVIED